MESVDTSISDFVTIIVKAPNQQIADQTIECQLHWTIRKLKDYLSEVYPSKPKLEEQKLIYSGKLLTDSAVLGDILRTYEGQKNHTVHLVCTTKAQKMNKIPTDISSSGTTRTSNTSTYASSSNIYSNTQSQHITISTTNTNSTSINGLNTAFFTQNNATNFPSFDPRYAWLNTSAHGLPNMNDMNANQQFIYMQQLYAQYFSQYMQMMGQPGFGYMASAVPQSSPRPSQSPTIPNNLLARDRVNFNGNQARENQPAVGAVGNDIDDEDGHNNRDWLDWFYVFSRVVVLFSVVYFYSTPLRLLAVLLLVCMFYLHQNIRMQNDHFNINNNNNNNNVINHNNNPNNNRNDENRPIEANLEIDDENHRRGAENVDTNDNATSANSERSSIQSETITPPMPERFSPITVTLLAIRTFFLSLVPDQPVL